jgi:hypothetical protein
MHDMKMRELVALEEKAGRDAPLDARIHTVDMPPDDEKGLSIAAREVYNENRTLFKSYEEAEYFAMLPLSMKQRDHVLARAVQFSERDREEKKLYESMVQSDR